MNRDGSQNLTLVLKNDFRQTFDELFDKEVTIEIKKISNHRSLQANAYFWELCGQIAKKSSKYSSDGKNDVYREAIRAKGEFEPLLIRKDALNKFISRWSDKGTGWFAEVVDTYKDNYLVVHAYYGSSTYDSVSMGYLIDYVIHIANDLGIPTLTENEEKRMLLAWDKRYQERFCGNEFNYAK